MTRPGSALGLIAALLAGTLSAAHAAERGPRQSAGRTGRPVAAES
jgi:hypothetical protein